MLPKIILTLVQLYVGWTFAPQIRAMFAVKLGNLDIFILAVIVAVLVWLVGHLGALVLKETAAPTSQTLVVVLVLALIFAGLTLVPVVTSTLDGTLGLRIPTVAYPLLGAVLGYLLKR
jgi:hypothetical protein